LCEVTDAGSDSGALKFDNQKNRFFVFENQFL